MPSNRPLAEPLPGLLIADPVLFEDGCFHLCLPGGHKPILLGGAPVTAFAEGWFPSKAFLGFAPVLLLEFRHQGGGSALWFLDHKVSHLSGSAAELSRELRDVVRAGAMPILREIMAVIHDAYPPRFSAETEAFLGLADSTRRQIAALFADELVPFATIYPFADLAGGQPPTVRGADDARYSFGGNALAAGFRGDWQQKLIEAAREGALLWPSPVDGVPLACRGSIIFDDFVFAYRFVDERFSLVFYVLVSEHRSVVAGVWFPGCGVLMVENDAARPLGEKLRNTLPHLLLTHLLDWAPSLRAYFSTPPKTLSNLLRGDPAVHIGHQLWNELSGIETLLQHVPEPRFGHLVMGRHDRLELYGPIDAIFPALHGRVDRDSDGLTAMKAESYSTGRVVFRVTQEYVSASLRRRLLQRARSQSEHLGIRFPDAPVLLIGLRVENRTLADLDGFLTRLVEMLFGVHPTLHLVFDGHNSGDRNGGPIGSHGESMALTAPDLVEAQIVSRLRERFASQRDRIHDTIMQPVSASLAWADRSVGFVSIWGASLAKYRWVGNLPGFVISSRHNLLHRGDIDIYHSPRYMETPAPIEFVDPALVTDLPDSPPLVPVGLGQPSFFNFRLDEDAVLSAIGRFVETLLAERPEGALRNVLPSLG